MLHLDAKYLHLVSHRLQLFKKLKDYTYKFRCPFCGDSSKNKVKTRGYIFRKRNDLFYMCHNCNESKTFQNFLEFIDRNMHDQYTMERWESKQTHRNSNFKKPKFEAGKAPTFQTKKELASISYSLCGLPSINDLADDHECKQYVINRQIPKYIWSKLFYAEDFKKFGEEFTNTTDSNLPKDKRLIIAFYNDDNVVNCIQGRSMDPDPFLRYITLKTDDDVVKVYGEDRVDKSKPVRVVEGPIDSLFVFNCVGSADANLMSVSSRYDERVLIFDAQPRNPQLVRIIEKAVNAGESVCFLPTDGGKDINDMYTGGMSVSDIDKLITNNTYHGLEASIEFNKWRKV